MNLVGNRRGGASKLAQHLMNAEDNEHVHIHEMRGFVSDDLHGAFHEAHSISRGTRCQKFLYSLSLNPPKNVSASIEVFEEAIEEIERKLGFLGQPRAIVFHEKKGRRHAHCVWSRIDSAFMRAIDPYEDKRTLQKIARQLFLEHGWEMPPGLKRKGDADPFNYSHAEHQHAKRIGPDPKELKRLFAECWQRSDSRGAFAHALKEHGLILARGDRRGHVALDRFGEVYAISRWVGVKVKEVRVRLGESDDLPGIEEALRQFDVNADAHLTEDDSTLPVRRELERLERKRQQLVAVHRNARDGLYERQRARRIIETKGRSDRIPVGLKAAWLKLSGQYQAILEDIEADATLRDARDRAEQQNLIERQLQERRVLQSDILRLQGQLPGLASGLLRLDPMQELIIPPDADVLTQSAKVRNDPVHILNVLTETKEHFSRTDIVRGLSEHIPDPAALSKALQTVMRSTELVEAKSEPKPVYTTRDMLTLKKGLADRATDLSGKNGFAVDNRHADAAISAQNKSLQQTVGASLSEQQEQAIRHCTNGERLSAIIGLAGAGKSTMLAAVREAWERQGFWVTGAALSGKAADGLETASGIQSRTLASFERSWQKGYSQLSAKDVLVIDEAGMIGTRQMERFVAEIQKTGAKLILVGDPEQLQPINAGTPFRDIARQISASRLTEIHRQKEGWQKRTSLDFAEQRIKEALAAYELHGKIRAAGDTSEAIVKLVEDYMADFSLNRIDVSRLALAHRRKDVHAINQAIRAARQSAGDLLDETLVKTDHGNRAFARDDRILLTKNDRDLGVRNGMIGTVETVTESEITIRLDRNGAKAGRSITLNPKLYTALDHGYATTIHKSQGATVENVYVLGSATMDRHLTYVAMTRHRRDAYLHADSASLHKLRCSSREQQYGHPPRQHRRHRPSGPQRN